MPTITEARMVQKVQSTYRIFNLDQQLQHTLDRANEVMVNREEVYKEPFQVMINLILSAYFILLLIDVIIHSHCSHLRVKVDLKVCAIELG